MIIYNLGFPVMDDVLTPIMGIESDSPLELMLITNKLGRIVIFSSR